ncbi:MAG TPA: DMT family transporter [Propionibacteriaceae bacterium]|nr:DMT family transporter [Propionibacteriaceae bacterium]
MTAAPAAPPRSVEPLDTPIAPRRWLPGMMALAAIWGSSFLFIKVGVTELHPLFVALGRVLGGAIALVVVLLLTRDRLPWDPRFWGHNAVVAVLGVALPFTLFGFGEQRISSVLAGIWNSVTPLVALPMAVLVFRTERLTRRRALGLVLGFVGAATILGVWQGVGGSSLAGQLMCLTAAACYGVAIPYTRRFLTPRPESGLAVSAGQLLIATVLLGVVAPLAGGGFPAVAELSGPVLASVAALGVLGTGLAFVLHLRNIRLLGASTASMVTYLIPVFATVIGVMVLGEALAWFQPVGAAIVLLGVAVAQRVSRPSRAGTP